MALAQKYGEAPKMLNQASMLHHFLILTAFNGSPLKALLRRDFARRELSEQTGYKECTEKEKQALVSVSSNHMFRTFQLSLKLIFDSF
jgi:hypothetical protein